MTAQILPERALKIYETPIGNYELACPAVNHYYKGGRTGALYIGMLWVHGTRKLELDKVCVTDISICACAVGGCRAYENSHGSISVPVCLFSMYV